MSVHSLGPRLVAQPPERICSKLVFQVPGVRNQPHLVLSRQARSVRGLPRGSGLHQHQESIPNFRSSSSASHLFLTFPFVDFTALCGNPKPPLAGRSNTPRASNREVESPSLTCHRAPPKMRDDENKFPNSCLCTSHPGLASSASSAAVCPGNHQPSRERRCRSCCAGHDRGAPSGSPAPRAFEP